MRLSKRVHAFLRTSFALLGGIVPLAAGAAQDTIPLFERGTRVRLYAPSASPRPVTGAVATSRSDLIAVVTRRYVRVTHSPMQLTRIDVSSGRSRWRGAVRGTLFGAAAGFVVISPLLWSGAGPHKRGVRNETHELARTGAYVLTTGGLLVGTLVGSERWVTSWKRPKDWKRP